MPIHDWSRVEAGTFHNFHQGWSIRLRDALNEGVLPPGFIAVAESRVKRFEGDVVAMEEPDFPSQREGFAGLMVADVPPQIRQVGRTESESDAYARRANKIVIRRELGSVVAVIEIVSPGNKDRPRSMRDFVEKAADLLRGGIHLLVVDLFPPTARDPLGIHQAIWDEMSGEPFQPRPDDKPLTAASYDAGEEGLTAYMEPLAVGDKLPDMPLFLESGVYVPAPLEASYEASWRVLPPSIRAIVERSATR